MPFREYRRELASLLANHWNESEFPASYFETELASPPNPQLGQLTLPCFKLSKSLKKKPAEIAQEAALAISHDTFKFTALGPYLNINIAYTAWHQAVFKRLAAEIDRYGSDDRGRGKTVVLEYCSPNIAKRLGFQHIRSSLIGNTLANVYAYAGYDTQRINFVGDWGAQFARLVAAVELWGDIAVLKNESLPIAKRMDELLKLYVQFHDLAEKDPSLLEKASQCLQKLENREPAVLQMWQTIRAISQKAMDATLARMHIHFDHIEGESHYLDQLAAVMEETKVKAKAKLSEGAWIVELENIDVPALIQKKDGTTLYLTRDIAAALDRWKRFKFDSSLYMVSEQQKLHFQQLFGVLKQMGNDWSERCHHVAFGTVLFGAGKMSTRQGKVIFLDDLLDQAKELALKEVTEKNPELKDKDRVSEMVGIGAVIFGQLSSHRMRDIQFDWKQVLALDGETGPYVQYSAVRCQSLLAKAGLSQSPCHYVPISEDKISHEEGQLLVQLSKFRHTVAQVIDGNDPMYLTGYLIDVAKAFNQFYYRYPVLQATETSVREFRLGLAAATLQVLKNGLHLLGIETPDEM